MEEIRPEDLEEMVQELEEEKDAQEPITSGVRVDGEVVDSFLARVFHDRRWKWAPVYAAFLLVATSLVFAVDSLWTLLAAGVVWLAGGVLGLVILGRKGYSVGGDIFRLLDFGDDTPGCLLVLLALFALVGPMIMLVALLIRPRGSTVGTSRRRAKSKAPVRKGSGPADEGDSGASCTACGAWNPAGSETCDECGAALAGAEA
jgi:hypothetical protein